jgi:uncharacterized protein (TIGR02001 family)
MKVELWKTVSTAAAAALCLGCGAVAETPPDTSTMPQLALPQAVAPDEAPSAPLQLTFSATAASNYTFRGVSQTENAAALFGAARVDYKNFYLGVGGENVDFHNSTDAEYDLSGGWTPVVSGFRLDLGFIRYGYVNQPAHTEIDTTEAKAVVLHDLGPATVAVAVYYTSDFFGSHHDAVYVEGRGSYRITKSLTASGAVGRQTIDSGTDHTTWNAGLTYAFTKHVGLDLRYADTDRHELGKTYASHFVAAIKGSF